MTVNKTGTSSSTTTKNKKTSSNSTTASTSKTSSSKTSKVVESKATKQEIVHSEGLSKSSSSSSLQISDVSHLPLKANLTTYMVTEALPTGSGEKITTYHPDTGATSTEYRHFVEQDTSAQHSTQIQQIGSVLNQSIQNLNESTSNLSQVSGSTYTVTEPMEELKLSYNPNDSAWNGKFVQEQPLQSGKKTNTIVKQSSTATSQQESSSSAKTTSSSCVVEIVDGKERIIDQKHHEASRSTNASNEERLEMKSGTDVEPEVHYMQKSAKSSTKMDSAKPELQQPKRKSSQAVKEIHQVGEQIISSSNIIQDKAVSSTHAVRDKTKNFIDTEISDSINKRKAGTTSTEQTSKNLGSTSSATKTITYYDSKGNIVKTVTEVDSDATPGSEITSSDITQTHLDENFLDSSNIRTSETTTDSKNFHENVVDSSRILEKNVHDSKYTTEKVIKDNTVQSTDIHSNDRNYENIPSKFSQGVPVTSTPRKQISPSRETKTSVDESTTYYVDDNYVDTNKIRQAQASTDSTDFYGHNVDSSKTMVSNVYDTSAIQNTIGYRERVTMDENMDTTDLVFSNDRNYGKTGWNGQFTYEKPQQVPNSFEPGLQERKTPSSGKPEKKSPHELPAAGAPSRKEDKQVPETRRSQSPLKKSPEDFPAAGAPSRPDRKSPEKHFHKPTIQTQDFLTTETQENIKQITEDTTAWKKIVDEGSSSVIEGDTTIEYFKIVDGKKIPIGQKIIPGKTVTESYDNVTGRRESKSMMHGTNNLIDNTDITEQYSVNRSSRRPEELPVAGMPSRKPIDKTQTDQKSTPKDKESLRRNSLVTEYIEIEGDTTTEYFKIVDGKKIPAGTKIIPGITKTNIYDNTIAERDSTTTVVRDSQKFVDKTSTSEQYSTVEGRSPKGRKITPEELPAAGMPSRRPGDIKSVNQKNIQKDIPRDSTTSEFTEIVGDTTIEYFEIVDGKRIPTGQKVIPGKIRTEINDRFTEKIDSTTNFAKDYQTSTTDYSSTVEDIRRTDGKQPKKTAPEELPVAGIPSRRPEDKIPTSKDKEDYTGFQKTLDQGSSTVIEGNTTIEYFKIVDGKKIPIGQKVIPGSTTTEYFDNISGRRESKTVIHDTKILVDDTNTNEENITVEREKYIDKKPSSKKPSKLAPEDLPAAGSPSRRPADQKLEKTDQKNAHKDSITTEYTEIQGDTVIEYFDIVDGKRIPKGTKVIPGTSTTKECYQNTDRRDSVTNVVRKSEIFVDDTHITEKYFIVDGKRIPIDDMKFGNVKDSRNVTNDSKTFVESTNIFTEYTSADGKRVPTSPGDRHKPHKVSPDELPAAGMPSRKDKKTPDDRHPNRPESPQKKGKLYPEDLPAAGRPSKPIEKDIKLPENRRPGYQSPTKKKPSGHGEPYSPDSTVFDIVETVSNVSESKKTLIKDSQSFIDYQSNVEQYTIVNGEKVLYRPDDKLPVEELRTPTRKSPEELPAAGMPSKKDRKSPEDRTPKKASESPKRAERISPESLPVAGRPSRPREPDSTTKLESLETRSNVFDSKTSIIKNSKTFIDNESSIEHYTTIDNEISPLGPDGRSPLKDSKKPKEILAAGMPSRSDNKDLENKSSRKKPDSPTRKDKVRPENLPVAGKPSKLDDKSKFTEKKPTEKYPESSGLIDSITKFETFETVSKIFDSKTTVVKDAQKYIDSENTVEHYTLINDERVPLTPGDRKPIEDLKRPEELPAAGIPSRRLPKTSEDKSPKKKPEFQTKIDKLRPEDLPVAGRPSTTDDRSVVPKKKPSDKYPESPDVMDSTTTVESLETVSKVFDSKTTAIKDSETFIDNESTVEHYTIVNGERVLLGPGDRKPIEHSKKPEQLPAAGVPSRRLPKTPEDKSPKKKPESPTKIDKLLPEDLPVAGRPSTTDDRSVIPKKKPSDKYPESPDVMDATTTVESLETVSKVFDSKTTVIKDSQKFVDNESTVEHYTIVNGERVLFGPGDRKPIEHSKRPEELPAAGVPSRRLPKTPEDKSPKKKPESPTKINKLRPEDLPVAGRPSSTDDRSVIPKKKPSDKYPEFPDVIDSTTTVESLETVSKVFDSKTTVIKDSQKFVDSESTVEHYTIINGESVPLSPGDRKPIDELPAAGMPSRRGPKKTEDKSVKTKPKSPTRKDKVRPEDFPAAGRPSKPDDKSAVPKNKPSDKYPESPDVLDSTRTVENFETVSKVFDSKTTVIKDSQTFVDHQKNIEHYTITNDERLPKQPGDMKPLREKPAKKSPEELPAAGKPSKKKPDFKKPTRGPDGPDFTTLEDYEVVNNVVDIQKNITKDFTTKTIVENFTTDIQDIRDTVITDTVDRVDKTFIKEDIIDIKDVNEVENITNIKRVSENKVIKVEKIIKEPAPSTHYKPPMKEQCICELCICGTETSTSHSHK